MFAADLGLFLGYHPSTLITTQDFVMCQHYKRKDPSIAAAPLVLSPESPFMVLSYMNGVTITTATEDTSDIPGLVNSQREVLSMQSSDAQNRQEVCKTVFSERLI